MRIEAEIDSVTTYLYDYPQRVLWGGNLSEPMSISFA